MKRSAISAMAMAALVVCGGAAAPPPPPSSTTQATFLTAAELEAVIAQTKARRTEGQANVATTVFRVPPTSVNVEFRPAAGPAAIHPTMAEFFIVLQGSGEVTTGGEIVRPPALAAGGPVPPASIRGGVTRRVAKGDVFLVPANLPHAFTKSDGELVIMQTYLRLPEGAAVPAA